MKYQHKKSYMKPHANGCNIVSQKTHNTECELWKHKFLNEDIDVRDRSLFMWGVGGGWGGIMEWAMPIFLEKRGGPKENFTMIGGGSLCVPDQSALPEFKYLSVHMMKMVRSVFPMIGSHDQILRSSSSKGSCQLMHRMLSQNFPPSSL